MKLFIKNKKNNEIKFIDILDCYVDELISNKKDVELKYIVFDTFIVDMLNYYYTEFIFSRNIQELL